MVRIDMSEYMEKHSVSRLTGPPPGYIGYVSIIVSDDVPPYGPMLRCRCRVLIPTSTHVPQNRTKVGN
jgi:AAA domain (Cdc48 subfamily)